MAEPVRPARPHLQLTDEGRRKREVLTYSRRGSRFTPKQQQAWDAHAEAWVIPDEAVDEPGFDLTQWFGREAPLIIEIGCGVGEATGVLAAAHPDHNVLGLEVWRPGMAAALAEVDAAGADHVRFCSVDAVWLISNLIPDEGLAGLWTFFPDPWPKTKHHKRRMVTPAFAATVATKLATGAEWRLATDWAEYADRMRQVLDDEPALDGGQVERWDLRPVTKFERKGVEVDRDIADFCYRRTPLGR